MVERGEIGEAELQAIAEEEGIVASGPKRAHGRAPEAPASSAWDEMAGAEAASSEATSAWGAFSDLAGPPVGAGVPQPGDDDDHTTDRDAVLMQRKRARREARREQRAGRGAEAGGLRAGAREGDGGGGSRERAGKRGRAVPEAAADASPRRAAVRAALRRADGSLAAPGARRAGQTLSSHGVGDATSAWGAWAAGEEAPDGAERESPSVAHETTPGLDGLTERGADGRPAFIGGGEGTEAAEAHEAAQATVSAGSAWAKFV